MPTHTSDNVLAIRAPTPTAQCQIALTGCDLLLTTIARVFDTVQAAASFAARIPTTFFHKQAQYALITSSNKYLKRHLLHRLLLLIFLTTLLSAFAAPQATVSPQRIYLPLVSQVKGIGYNGVKSFGFETTAGHIRETQTLSHARELKAGWIRLNIVSWKVVQPTADSAYNWAALDYFEKDLKTALANGLTPIVGIKDSPHWAVKQVTRDGKPFFSSCAAIASEHFQDYANFIKALVQRYSAAPYGVRYWELGNEPDIDPTIISVDSTYGCWGDISDPYYGGRHYGAMLKVVYPVIKSVSPSANVLIGGLLLDRPTGDSAGRGHPEKFFEGILVAGGGSFFDIVAFHGYPHYRGSQVDSDLVDERWAALGGMTHGKVQFLRDIMAKYQIDKPLFYDEVALLVQPSHTADSLKAQGDFLVKQANRALNEGVQGIAWYTLNESGFFSSGLLDPNHEPRPAFNAYRTLIQAIGMAQAVQKFDGYGPSFEAYRYEMGNDRVVDVVWSTTPATQRVTFPSAELEKVVARDGAEITVDSPAIVAVIPVGFSPVYIYRHKAR